MDTFKADLSGNIAELNRNHVAVPSGSEAVRFTKMHGLGNDYVYLLLEDNPRLAEASEAQLSALARCISHRHLGVGGDGMVMIAPSEVADFRMRMWNADGSEAQMCGNASRCVGKFVFDSGLTSSTHISLETLAGIKQLELHVRDAQVESVTVDMGRPTLAAAERPMLPDAADALPAILTAETEQGVLRFTGVSMGNPHGVAFVDEVTDDLVLGTGPRMEVHEAWPEKANIEFAHVQDRENIEMRVWERGTGETMACGTGACATAVAAILHGLTDRRVRVHLPGGTLEIYWDAESDHVLMTGPATTVASGIYFYQQSV